MAKVTAILQAVAKERGVKKLNRELEKLFKTGQKLDRLKINIGGSVSNLERTQRAISSISRELNRLKTKRIRILADTGGASGEIRRLNDLVKNVQKLRVSADTSEARREITTLNTLVDNLQKLRISADTGAATREIIRLNELLQNTQRLRINADTEAARREIIAIQELASKPQSFRVNATGGDTGGGGGGGGGGLGLNSRMFVGFGGDFARGFRGAMGAGIFEGGLRAGRSAAGGILRADEVDALARSAGVDVETLRTSVRKATDEFKGAPIAEIMESSIEQASFARQRIDQMVADGTLKAADAQAEYQTQLDDITRRVARNTQVLTTATGDAAAGAEQARQLEKALAITGVQIDPDQAKKYSESILRAVVASGFDQSPDEIKRSLQQMKGPLASQVSDVGLARLTLMRDEGGKAATAAVRMFYDGLTSQGINAADMEQQRKAGIRAASGMSTIATDLWKDPVDLVTKTLIPAAEKAKVDLDDAVAVSAFYQKEFGLTPSRAEFPTAVTVQREQLELERQRIAAVQPDVLAKEATLRVELANIEAQFQNAAATMTKDFMPQIKAGAGQISEMFKVAAKPDKTLADYTQLSQAALAATFAGAVPALMDPATRPLTMAGLGLQVAGTVLLTAANELVNASDEMISWFTGKPSKSATEEQAKKAAHDAAVAAQTERGMSAFPTLTAGTVDRTAELQQKLVELTKQHEILAEGGSDAAAGVYIQMLDIQKKIEAAKSGVPGIEILKTKPAGMPADVSNLLGPISSAPIPLPVTLAPTAEDPTKKWLEGMDKLGGEGAGGRGPTGGISGKMVVPRRMPGQENIDVAVERMDAVWSASIAESGTTIRAAFNEGGVAAGQSVSTGLTAGGASIAEQIRAACATGGALLANAVSSAVANVKVNVGTQVAGVDTGAQTVQ